MRKVYLKIKANIMKLTKEEKQYAKDKPSDLANVTLGHKHLSYQFRQALYTYKGHESTGWDSICELVPGNSYMVRDDNCESHQIDELIKFVRVCKKQSIQESFRNSEYFLFIDEKKNYWLVEPRACIDNVVKNSIQLILYGSKLSGKLNQKIVEEEEKAYRIV